MLFLYATEITEDKHCCFGCKRSTNNRIICIRQVFQKGWNDAEIQLFVHFKKAYDSLVILIKLWVCADKWFLLFITENEYTHMNKTKNT